MAIGKTVRMTFDDLIVYDDHANACADDDTCGEDGVVNPTDGTTCTEQISLPLCRANVVPY